MWLDQINRGVHVAWTSWNMEYRCLPVLILFLVLLFRCVIYRLPDAHKHITYPPPGVIFPEKVIID